MKYWDQRSKSGKLKNADNRGSTVLQFLHGIYYFHEHSISGKVNHFSGEIYGLKYQ